MTKPLKGLEWVAKVISPTQRSPRMFLSAVLLFAFVLRLAVMFATHSYRVENDDTDYFGFGWEMGRVARSLVEGNGFSSPLPSPTGPTAIVGPVYPLLLALVFKVFGVYSTGSAIAIRVLQCAFASLTCVFIFLCGRDALGEATGRLAAIAWALFPLNIFFTTNKVWETSLTAMLTAALFWVMLPLRHSQSVSRWAATGGLLGVAALLNTSLAVLVIPFGLAALWRYRVRLALPVLASVLTLVAVLAPWLVRNHTQFGKFLLRSNFALEFRVGNNELSYGEKIAELHPSKSAALNQHWHDIGEARFMAEERDLNRQFLAAHPGRFVFGTLSRIVNYWTGAWLRPTADSPNSWPVILGTSLLTVLGWLGIRQMRSNGNPVGFMFAGCLCVYPFVYYLTTSQPRFYHAITPLLVVSAAFWVVNLLKRLAPTTAL